MGHRHGLRGHRLGRAVAGYALFVVVEMAVWMVVVLWAFDRGGAALAAGASVAQLLPATVLAPALAGLGDRGDRGRALLLAHAGTALAVGATAAALLADAGTATVVVASTAATTMISVVRPLHFAVLPQLARDPADLVRGNSRSGAAEALASCVGPAVAGFAVHATGAGRTMLGFTVVAAAGSALCLGLRVGPPGTGAEGVAASPWREATAGLRVVARDPAALALLLVLTTHFVLTGAFDVLGTAFATQALGLDGSAAGLVVGGSGLGMLLGAAVAARTSRGDRLGPVVLVGCALQGVAAAAVAATGALGPALVAMTASGAGATVMLVGGRTLLQRTTDDAVLARVFAVQESVSLLGLAAGAAIAPALVTLMGPDGAFVPIGLLCVLAAAACWTAVRRLDARAVVARPEAELLRAVPFLAQLPAYELERLARAARRLVVPAAEVVVRQGEPGADFFVVVEGVLEVEVDGVPTGLPLGPGDGFGEIALLRAVPRTATVRTGGPATLLAVRSSDFLAAVTGSADGHRVAQEVAAAHLDRDAARVGAAA